MLKEFLGLKKHSISIVAALWCFILLLPAPALADSTLLENGQAVQEFSAHPLDDRKTITPLDNGWINYKDHAQGYQLNHPGNMTVDMTLSAVRTRISSEQTRIDIYRDVFTPGSATPYTYINYSNRFLSSTTDHLVQENCYLNVNGRQVHLLRWERTPLARVPNDHRYYVCAEIIISSGEVYTIVFESTQPVSYYMTVLESFQLIPRQGSPGYFTDYAPADADWNEETRQFYQQYFGEEAPLTWGMFEPTAPFSFSYLQQMEKKFQYEFPILLVYQCLDSTPPLPILQAAHREGRTLELTLQTSSEHLSQAENQRLPYEILKGTYDHYLHDYARQLAEFDHPILFRLNNEMNGDWCSYSSYHTSRDPDLYIALWRYVYEIFEAEQADNIIWVWNPNDNSFPDFKWNHALLYYPGNEYVDVIGLTGYNTGTYYAGEKWRSFAHIYDQLYRFYAGVFDHPFMITEFGSNSVGGDKAAWIDDMFAVIDRYPRIKAAVWWNGTDWDSQMRPARIYRIDENSRVMDAFTRGLASSGTE